MRYKIFNLFFFLVLFSCVNKPLIETKDSVPLKSFFSNKGFALVYKINFIIEKLVKGKIEDRSLIIFQKNLKKNTSCKNNKFIKFKVFNSKSG